MEITPFGCLSLALARGASLQSARPSATSGWAFLHPPPSSVLLQNNFSHKFHADFSRTLCRASIQAVPISLIHCPNALQSLSQCAPLNLSQFAPGLPRRRLLATKKRRQENRSLAAPVISNRICLCLKNRAIDPILLLGFHRPGAAGISAPVLRSTMLCGPAPAEVARALRSRPLVEPGCAGMASAGRP